MVKWAKFLALSVGDRLKLFAYSLLVLLVHIALNLFGYQKVYTFLSSYPRRRDTLPGQSGEPLTEAKRCAYLVSVAARYGIIRAKCLPQALLVFWLLRRRGISTEIRIGVRRQGGSIIAHAWVKHGEVVISEGSQVEKNFSAFEDLPDVQ